MKKIKELLRDKTFTRGSLFIVFNAFLLYVLYFIIKNFGIISGAVAKGVATLLDAFWPLILGLILAYLLDPLVELIDRKLMGRFMKLPDDPVKAEKRKNLFHFISVILTMLIVLAALVAIIYGMAVLIIGKVVFGSLSDTFRELISGFSSYEAVFRNWIATNVPKGFASEKLAGLSGTLMNWIGDNVNATSVIGFFTSIGGSVVDVVIAVIISIYLLKDKHRFLGLWRKLLHLVMPQKGHAVLTETMSEINGVLSRFIRGALLDALIIAILSAVGLSVMGLDAAVFIGIFAGIANVIPYFGTCAGNDPGIPDGTVHRRFLARCSGCDNTGSDTADRRQLHISQGCGLLNGTASAGCTAGCKCIRLLRRHTGHAAGCARCRRYPGVRARSGPIRERPG